MYQLASNLLMKKIAQKEQWVQPRSKQGIQVGEKAKEVIDYLTSSQKGTPHSEWRFFCDLIGRELEDRGILISREVVDQAKYLEEKFPLVPAASALFSHVPFKSLLAKELAPFSCFGVSCDLGASKPGCRFGPDHLRERSSAMLYRGSLFSLSAHEEMSFDEMLCDLGNISDLSGNLNSWIDAVERVVETISLSSRPLMLGGDHSLTLGALRGLSKKHPDFTLIQLDSHLDLQVWGEWGEAGPKKIEAIRHSNFISHAVSEIPGMNVVQFGVREFQSIPKDSSAQVVQYLKTIGEQVSDLAIQLKGAPSLQKLPIKPKVYLSIDVDVFKESEMGNTGYPNSTGLNLQHVLPFLQEIIREHEVIGLDIMEFGKGPQRDDHRLEADLVVTLLLALLQEWGAKWGVTK